MMLQMHDEGRMETEKGMGGDSRGNEGGLEGMRRSPFIPDSIDC
jgi:hypothetical protein